MSIARKKPAVKVKKEKIAFDHTIREVYGINKTPGDIGVEIEVEFTGKVKQLAGKYWTTVQDGSLRNGLEYVLQVPVPIKDIPLALEELSKATKGGAYKFSNRCSVHVHVNVQELKLHEFVKACTAWWLVENLMTRTQGANREGNLFALRGKDAEAIILSFAEDVSNGFQNGPVVRPRSDPAQRYASLNLAALRKFGSMEFRFLRGTLDIEEIDFWVRALYNLVHNAKGMNLEAMVALASGGPLDKIELLDGLIGRAGRVHLVDAVGRDWPQMIDDNIHYGILLSNAYDGAMVKIMSKSGKYHGYRFDDNEDIDRGIDPFRDRLPERPPDLPSLWAVDEGPEARFAPAPMHRRNVQMGAYVSAAALGVRAADRPGFPVDDMGRQIRPAVPRMIRGHVERMTDEEIRVEVARRRLTGQAHDREIAETFEVELEYRALAEREQQRRRERIHNEMANEIIGEGEAQAGARLDDILNVNFRPAAGDVVEVQVGPAPAQLRREDVMRAFQQLRGHPGNWAQVYADAHFPPVPEPPAEAPQGEQANVVIVDDVVPAARDFNVAQEPMSAAEVEDRWRRAQLRAEWFVPEENEEERNF